MRYKDQCYVMSVRRPQLEIWQRSRGLSFIVTTLASLCSTRLPSTTLLYQLERTIHCMMCGENVLPECHVLLVHPGGGIEGDVELRVVSVSTVIGHAQYTRAGVGHCIALVCEWAIPDTDHHYNHSV